MKKNIDRNDVPAARSFSTQSEKTAPTGATSQFSRLTAGIMICLATLAFSPRLADISNTVRFTLSALCLLVVVLAMARRHMSRRAISVVPVTMGTVAFALFLLLQIISLLWAPNKAEALFDIAKWLIVAVLIIVAYNSARFHPLRFIVDMSRVSAVLFAITFCVAFWQFAEVGDFSYGRPLLPFGRDSWSSRYCIVSLFSHKSTYSMVILLTMAFPLMRLTVCRGREKSPGQTLFFIALLTLQAGMIVILMSRAALVAMLATLAALALLSLFSRFRFRCPAFHKFVHKGARRHTWPAILITALLTGVVIIGVSRLFAEAAPVVPSQEQGLKANASINERQSLWRMTFRMIDGRPLLGCGAGNWKVCYPSAGVGDVFSIDMLDFNFVRPHNDYLRVLAETGYPALALLLVALTALWMNAAAIRYRSRHGRMARAAAAFVVGTMAFALTDFPLDRIETLLWTALLAATALSCGKIRRVTPCGTVPYATMAILMLLVFLFGTSRWRSETHYAAIVSGIHHRQWHLVEQHCHQARSPWYNTTPLGMPVAYYEAMAQEYQRKPAIETFRTALHDSPWCKQALNDLGRLEYVEHHNVDTAIAMLRQAIRISPGYSYAYFNLAQLYIQEKRWQEAVAVLDSLVLDHKEAAMRRMAWHYHQGKTAIYYTDELVPAERRTLQALRTYAHTQLQSE